MTWQVCKKRNPFFLVHLYTWTIFNVIAIFLCFKKPKLSVTFWSYSPHILHRFTVHRVKYFLIYFSYPMKKIGFRIKSRIYVELRYSQIKKKMKAYSGLRRAGSRATVVVSQPWRLWVRASFLVTMPKVSSGKTLSPSWPPILHHLWVKWGDSIKALEVPRW